MKNVDANIQDANDELGPYEPPQVLEVFQLEALAVVCTDTNAKNDIALGCNPGALFS